jgi:hypothetical protein
VLWKHLGSWVVPETAANHYVEDEPPLGLLVGGSTESPQGVYQEESLNDTEQDSGRLMRSTAGDKLTDTLKEVTATTEEAEVQANQEEEAPRRPDRSGNR